jgi:hypothetical protein
VVTSSQSPFLSLLFRFTEHNKSWFTSGKTQALR